MSNPSDVAGADEDGGKGRTPKGVFPSGRLLGHRMNNPVTVIRSMDSGWGAIKEKREYRGVTFD